MDLPYWLSDSLTPLPGLLLVYAGLGIPWALVVLPRSAWSSRASVAAIACVAGPLLLTLWMLPLGMAGALQLEPVLAGVVALLLAGLLLAWRKGRRPSPAALQSPPLSGTEKFLLLLIGLALLPRLLSIAYWPFTAYDALWVFGHEARLYTLTGGIPALIGYYPQFLPLQFTFTQLLAGGVDDHAARAVLFFTHAGCALAVYLAGARLFSRRVGIFAAALWALYPHTGEWARFGDLEIVLTMLFTLTATFFLQAWTDLNHRRRHALIAGLLLGCALWTKPTAGALVWGVLLLLLIELWRVRFNWRAFRPRLSVALLTGLASLPHGAVWYLRNVALGHNAIDFPDAFWLERAARSGAEFGWPLLGLLCLLLALGRVPYASRTQARQMIIGLTLLLAALLPTIFGQLNITALQPLFPPRRIQALEWAMLAAGALLLWRSLWPLLPAAGPQRNTIAKCAWALAMSLPWFVTWFWSYSYHYRLSFAIVPLLILPCALCLAHWLSRERVQRWSRPRRALSGVALCVIALPGITSTLLDPIAGSDWLQPGHFSDDTAKYTSGNIALMRMVNRLQIYAREHPEEPLVVAAPGVKRLPFFFPLDDIRVYESPTRLQELEDVRFYVDSIPENPLKWDENAPGSNQILGALSLARIGPGNTLRFAWQRDDGNFSYTLYELNLERRFETPDRAQYSPQSVDFGGFARYRGHEIRSNRLWPGRQNSFSIYWEALNEAEQDYSIFLHLRDAQGNLITSSDGPVGLDENRRFYSTLVWEPGEFIRDERQLRVPEDREYDLGEDYALWIGIYDWRSGERLPVTIDGEPAGDSYRINEDLTMLAEDPD